MRRRLFFAAFPSRFALENLDFTNVFPSPEPIKSFKNEKNFFHISRIAKKGIFAATFPIDSLDKYLEQRPPAVPKELVVPHEEGEQGVLGDVLRVEQQGELWFF